MPNVPSFEQTQTYGMERRIVFSPETLVALMQHYTEDCEDRIPLNARIIGVSGHPMLQRMVGLLLESDQWEGGISWGRENKVGVLSPLQFRYEGGKVLLWGGRDQELSWTKEENRFE